MGLPCVCCLVAVCGYDRKAKLHKNKARLKDHKPTKKASERNRDGNKHQEKPSGTHELSRKQGWEKKQHTTLPLTEETTTTHEGTLWTLALRKCSTLVSQPSLPGTLQLETLA